MDSRGYSLRADIAFCVANRRVVFLNLATARYFALSPTLDAAFQRTMQSEMAEPTDIAQLVEAGLMSQDFQPRRSHSAPNLPTPTRDIPCVTRSNTKRLLAHCILAQLMAARRLRRRTLIDTVRWICQRRTLLSDRISANSEGQWPKIAGAFLATHMLRINSDHCLTSSLAALDVGLSLSADAQLVFGVYPSPFSAHSWLQAGDTVLNDRVEYVRTFTPIMAV